MRAKEINQKLGIKNERIKLFKREGVFSPENSSSETRSINYTETDCKNLQLLDVLTKMGLTCGDIRNMQNGNYTLEEAVTKRRNYIESDMVKKRNALSLLSKLLDDKAEFETFNTDYYSNIITERESEGDEFIDVEDVYGYRPVSLIRTVKCPCCGEEMEIDLEDYETDMSSYENENGMGPDIVYYFDSEDNVECPSCNRRYQVTGWIREYPEGAYDSEDIDVLPIEDKD